MAEYIDRELLKERFRKRLDWLKKDIHDEYSGALYDCCEYDTKLIDEITAADVAPVIHAHWTDEITDCWHCSNCLHPVLLNGAEEYVFSDYCPHCGAQMDEKEDKHEDYT